MQRSSRDDKLADAIVILRRHLRSCRQCTAAIKGMDATMICDHGLLMTLDAAKLFDQLIKLRIAAHNRVDGTVFACPDLSKHGRSYALTAEPYAVSAIKQALF